MKHYTIDIETRSLYDIKENVYAFSEHTQILMIAICSDDFEITTWDIYQGDLEVIKNLLTDENNIFFAHNGLRFDFILLENCLRIKIANAIDTLSLFSPYLNEKQRSLAKIASMFGRSKNEVGKDMIKMYSNPLFGQFMEITETFSEYLDRVKKSSYNDCFKPLTNDYETYLQYCIDDTIELMHLVKRIPFNLDLDMYRIDKEINYRGIRIDLDFTEKLVNQAKKLTDRAVESCTVSRKVLRSSQQLTAHMASLGVHLPNAQSETLEGLIEADVAGSDILNARLQISKNCASKALKLLDICVIDRLYNYMSIDYAHTGRWQSSGANLYNMDKDSKEKCWDLYEALANGKDLTSTQDIMILTRLCFVPSKGKKFFICDFSGIEARIAAWVSGDIETLEKYKIGWDFYKELASRFYGVSIEEVTKQQRSLGKVGVLGCGYQMGWERLISYAATMGVIINEQESRGIVNAYRDSNHLIAGVRTGKEWEGHILRSGGVWKGLQQAFTSVILTGEVVDIAKCRLTRVESDVWLSLPSGRNLFYRDARIKMCKEDEETEEKIYYKIDGSDYIVTSFECLTYKSLRAEGYRPQICFAGNHSLFGGKILENICQAICVDFLRHCIKEISKSYDVVLHIYDEICTEIDNESDARHIETIMSTNPDWAIGFPLACEGFITDRFSKHERKQDAS